jgi:hypothetical protein
MMVGKNVGRVEIMVDYETKEPVGPYRFEVAPRRSRHLRFNNFEDPEPINPDTPFSSVITSDVPIRATHQVRFAADCECAVEHRRLRRHRMRPKQLTSVHHLTSGAS